MPFARLSSFHLQLPFSESEYPAKKGGRRLSTAVTAAVTAIQTPAAYLRFINVGMKDFIHESCQKKKQMCKHCGV